MLEVENLSKTFYGGLFRRQASYAVKNVSFVVKKGSVMGLAGGSGSGKSTVARLILRLIPPDSGTVRLEGAELTALPKSRLKPYRKRMQLISQNPEGSMDPSRRISYTMEEPLIIFGEKDKDARREKIREMFDMVGISQTLLGRYPHEISGGEAQRIAIARALLLEPELLVLDEPTSMLDVSIQAHIMTLLKELQGKMGLSYLFISHDIEVLRWFCDSIAIMDQGSIVEQGEAGQVLENPRHPFTKKLMEEFLFF